MPTPAADFWSELQQRTLSAYEAPLLKQTAARLAKPRSRWPDDEVLPRLLAAVANPTVIDRRFKELAPAGRQLLALVGHSRQSCWALGSLVELLMTLGHGDGLTPVLDLLNVGLLYPTTRAALRGEEPPRLKSLERWLGSAGEEGLWLFTTPLIWGRALGIDLTLPDLSDATAGAAPLDSVLASWHEADGLELPLRMALLWQRVCDAPLRRTQQGSFFKRDHERVGEESMLSGPAADQPSAWPDPGYLCAALAEQLGILTAAEGELRAGELPAVWEAGLPETLEALLKALPRLRDWNPLVGHCIDAPLHNPFASAGLLALLLMARIPAEQGLAPQAIEDWLREHHPYWAGDSVRPSRQQPWAEAFLLGVCYQMRIVQARRAEGNHWLVRLSPMGRWLLGIDSAAPTATAFPQTLLVQPNLEIVAYRQGLTPGLIVRLTRFADWNRLGAACTLHLSPESVYRGLERGESFDSIRLTLEQHGARAMPQAVVDSLRTWSNKRDRLTLWPSATLLEFDRASDLNEALTRGLPAVRISETLAVVADDAAIDYRQFRLLGTRDYGLPAEKCISVESDGVTLIVDAARSDLLLETELPRLAEPVSGTVTSGRRFRLTPASLSSARAAGWTPALLEAWFQQRVGTALTPAARLLLGAGQATPASLRRHLVLHLATPEIADGLLQWPATRALIAQRLGPAALSIEEAKVAELGERLREIGIEPELPDNAAPSAP